MQSVLDTLLIVGLSTALSIIGVVIVRQRFHSKDFTEHHEVAGYFLAIVGTLYAVLLGLLVVNVIAKFDQARTMAETEANQCSDIWHMVGGFPLDTKRSIRVRLKNYYNEVANEDWEAVRRSSANETSTVFYQQLWRSILDYQPAGNRESACYSAIVSSMNQLSDSRRFRLLSSRHNVSPIIWTVLATGGVLTIIFTYFFTVQSYYAQMALTALVALFISLNLLLIRVFDDPYRSEFRIKQESFSLMRLGESVKRDADGKVIPGGDDLLRPDTN